jgi:hypothetical protein
MNCWFCKHIMCLVDTGKKEAAEKLHQTEYHCSNCGALYVVSEHLLHGPTKTGFSINVPDLPKEEKLGREKSAAGS